MAPPTAVISPKEATYSTTQYKITVLILKVENLETRGAATWGNKPAAPRIFRPNSRLGVMIRNEVREEQADMWFSILRKKEPVDVDIWFAMLASKLFLKLEAGNRIEFLDLVITSR